MSAQAKALQIDYEAIGQVIYMTCITYIIKIIKSCRLLNFVCYLIYSC